MPRKGSAGAARGGTGSRLAKSKNRSQSIPPAGGGDQGNPADGLLAEWFGTGDLTAALRRSLDDRGVSREAVHRAGGLGAAQIHRTGRTFSFAGYGRLQVIMPVWSGAAPGRFSYVEEPLLLDLLAFHPSAPEFWLYRVGAPGLILGENVYVDALRSGAPFKAFATPLEFLENDCRGAVWLDDVERHWQDEREAIDARTAWGWRLA